jgi:hypothetical protein
MESIDYYFFFINCGENCFPIAFVLLLICTFLFGLLYYFWFQVQFK